MSAINLIKDNIVKETNFFENLQEKNKEALRTFEQKNLEYQYKKDQRKLEAILYK